MIEPKKGRKIAFCSFVPHFNIFNYFIYTIILIRVFGFVGKFDSMHYHLTFNRGDLLLLEIEGFFFLLLGECEKWMWKKRWKQNLLPSYRNHRIHNSHIRMRNSSILQYTIEPHTHTPITKHQAYTNMLSVGKCLNLLLSVGKASSCTIVQRQRRPTIFICCHLLNFNSAKVLLPPLLLLLCRCYCYRGGCFFILLLFSVNRISHIVVDDGEKVNLILTPLRHKSKWNIWNGKWEKKAHKDL